MKSRVYGSLKDMNNGSLSNKYYVSRLVDKRFGDVNTSLGGCCYNRQLRVMYA